MLTRLHDVRHAYATEALVAGVHPNILSAQLGHSDPAFTMRVYQHVLPNMTNLAAQAKDNARVAQPLASGLQSEVS